MVLQELGPEGKRISPDNYHLCQQLLKIQKDLLGTLRFKMSQMFHLTAKVAMKYSPVNYH